MSIVENINQTVTSNGNTTTVERNGVTQNISFGEYSATTPLTSIQCSHSGVRVNGSSRNVDITGNSQENYAGRGLTCEYSIRVVGSPELFEATAQIAADNALNDLVGLMLQPGDDRNFQMGDLIPKLNFRQIVSKMTSSAQSDLTPPAPTIKSFEDVPIETAKLASWFSSLSLSNLAFQAAKAAALEVERQVTQQAINIQRTAEALGNQFGLGEGSASSPSSEEKSESSYNITRQDVADAYLKKIDPLLAAQRQIG